MNDPRDSTLALRARGLLATFNHAGILTAADVHVADRLGTLGGETDEAVLLAAALTVRSTRHGSVVLDLATAAATTSPDIESPDSLTLGLDLPWPDDWEARCAASPLMGGPLRRDGSRLWLARYWEQEQQVAGELLARCAQRPDDLDPDRLAAGLARLFSRPEDADQRLAAAVCSLTRVSVLAGGPGTGKTTTVSRVLALLREQHPGWRIALAAPTGKAAARLEEAVRSSASDLPPQDRQRLGDLPATTLHRLLGWRPDARSRFRHNAGNHLALDVVVVDEASMIPLTMMARLLEALRPTTRLVLVGDPDQLASVEAGAVLGDLVDRDRLELRTPSMAAALRAVLPGLEVSEQATGPAAGVRDGVASLSTNRRFSAGGAIATLATAVRQGDAEQVLAVLRSGDADVEFVELDDDAVLGDRHTVGTRADVRDAGMRLHDAALAGDADTALLALEQHRLLCAHRTGPRGVQHWGALAARWIAEAKTADVRTADAGEGGHYPGEPLLVTQNDYEIGLYNGDSGVIVAGADGLAAVFGRGGAPIRIPLGRLGAARPLHAITVHRSQGSQFDRVTLILPVAGSPLATRETLYTAVTRAKQHVRLIGSAEAVTTATERPVARATGLGTRLGTAPS